jgi:hypothetical protein
MRVDGVSVKDFFFDNPFDAETAKRILDGHIDAKQVLLYKQDGKVLFSLDDAIGRLATMAREQGATDGQTVNLRFEIKDKPVYVHTNNPEIPRMRLAIIQGTYFNRVLAAGKTETKLTHTLRLLMNDQNYYVDSDHKVYKSNGIFAHRIELTGVHEGQEIRSSFELGANIADLENIHRQRTGGTND